MAWHGLWRTEAAEGAVPTSAAVSPTSGGAPTGGQITGAGCGGAFKDTQAPAAFLASFANFRSALQGSH